MRFSTVAAAAAALTPAMGMVMVPPGLVVVSPAELAYNRALDAMLAVEDVQLECKPITVLFARGTWEPQGGSGGTLVGGPFINGIKKAFPGQVAAKGVDYHASIMGYMEGGSAEGTSGLRKMVIDAVQSCPSTKLVVGGYSQGAQVVHSALEGIPLPVASRIAAVVTFGDPQIGRDISNIEPNRVDVLCQKNDPICKGEPIPLGSHLTYGKHHFMKDGIRFAVSRINSFSPGRPYTARRQKQHVNMPERWVY